MRQQRLLILEGITDRYTLLNTRRIMGVLLCFNSRCGYLSQSLVSFWSPHGYLHRLPKKALPTTLTRAALLIALNEMRREDVDSRDLNGRRVGGEEESLQWPAAIR